ncbi:MAG: histidinol-phosphatase [Muribaculaceae bacterium]|nr:histidinol-phosphatase [Muribaculaceae bacterium]
MLDFNRITQETELYNLHTHTQFCDGHATMEEFVTEAIAQGFTHLGFTPHSPVSVESPVNMRQEQVQDYFEEMKRLRRIYADRIHLYTSMEIDYVSVGDGPASDYFQQLPLDYRIGSVHFIPDINDPSVMVDIDGKYQGFKGHMEANFNGDIEYVVNQFFSQMMAMVEEGGFDIVGHMDKIGYNASQYRDGIDEEPWYDKLVIDLFENIMDHHLVIEVNTKAWLQRNRFYPNLKYFGMLKRFNAPVVINSDAHYPTLLNSGRLEAIKLLSVL